ncbi:MAG: SpoIID/LytB domain-containing protein [Candidatus Mcinerneyibacterium aminivorans]|uniref:SpoIID/LytB domain-containing protein n=1 Tax=Candidatus Mcinerneyibacterium aminivorans TaxID=2703815 RepID=A0A5D0MJK4_9BACT|nr:MAG: SpoIID/LytB domain-containing protein [Candidatus Mcinerneyibacterium aminivorans]
MKKKLLILIIFILYIKLLLAYDVSALILNKTKSVNLGDKEYRVEGKIQKISTISTNNGNLYINNIPTNKNKIELKALNGYNYINNKNYRGKIIIIGDYFALKVINKLDIESYLKGVLPKEINYKWPMSTLKAQAVAARTFVYKKIQENNSDIFHLDSSYLSQVYGGLKAERKSTNKAVKETENIVLTYKNEIIYSFYHSTSGGYTASSSEVWNSNGNSLHYLKAKRDPFSINTPHDNWSFRISKKRFKKLLNLKEIKNIKLHYTRSGRVKYIKITAKTKEFKITGNNLRLKLGSKDLKSTMFELKSQNGYFVFNGKGWGHGVGLSQWGAYYMGKKGYSYKQILKFYYTNVDISRVKT